MKVDACQTGRSAIAHQILRPWPFGGLPRRRFGVILADPPWRFLTWSEAGRDRSPDQHYPTMTPAQMMALPVKQLAAPNCALIMWVYDPMIPQALQLMQAWGFTFKTRLYDWAKETADGSDVMGLGHWTRHGGEQAWIGTIGNPRRRSRRVLQYHRERPREHSRKPAEFLRRTERLLDGPYLELFSRTGRDGWSAWGNEINKFGREE